MPQVVWQFEFKSTVGLLYFLEDGGWWRYLLNILSNLTVEVSSFVTREEERGLPYGKFFLVPA